MALTPAIVIVSALLSAASADAASTFEVIPLQHRSVPEILPALLPIVGAEGALAGNGDQIFVRASPEIVAAVKARIESLDRQSREMRLSVRQVFGRAQPLRPPGETFGQALSTSTYSEEPRDFYAPEGEEVAVPIRPDVADVKERARIGAVDAAIVDDSYRRAFGAALFLSAHVLDGDRIAIDVVTRRTDLADDGALRTRVEGRRGEWVDLGAALDRHARQGGAYVPLDSTLRVRVDPID
jgi:hypothetical protein